MANLENGVTTLRRYLKEHQLATPLEVHRVHEEVGPVHPDTIHFGHYFVQLFNRGGIDPDRRIFAPGLLTRIYNPLIEERRPFVFAIGAGGSSRLAGGEATDPKNTARDFILYEVIGWNQDQIMAHRGIPLRLRITHKDTLKEYARSIKINEDVPIPYATWENVLNILKLHLQDASLAAKISRVASWLGQFKYEEVMAVKPVIDRLGTSHSKAEASELATMLKEVRLELQQWGIGDRFNGTGRLTHCNEYVLPPGLFYTAPGVEIDLP